MAFQQDAFQNDAFQIMVDAFYPSAIIYGWDTARDVDMSVDRHVAGSSDVAFDIAPRTVKIYAGSRNRTIKGGK